MEQGMSINPAHISADSAPSTAGSAGTARSQLDARLSDPQVVGSLNSILDHADLLAVLVEGLDQFVARSEVIGDSVLSSIHELRGAVDSTEKADNLDLPGMAKAGVSLAGVLPKAAPGIVRAVESGAVDKLMATAEVSAGALDQVDLLARALTAGSAAYDSHPIQVGGPLSLVKLLRDPDINRAISFFATIAKAVGQELATTDPATGAAKA